MNRRHFVASLGMSAALSALSQAQGVTRQDGGGAQVDKVLARNPVWPRPMIVLTCPLYLYQS